MCDLSPFDYCIPEGCSIDGQVIIDNDGFGSYPRWTTEDKMDYLSADSCMTHSLGEVEKWNRTSEQSNSYFIDPRLCSSEGQQFMSNEQAPTDIGLESAFGDRRVSNSSSDSNTSDFGPAVGACDPFSPSVFSFTAEPSGRTVSKPRWLCEECGSGFRTSSKLESHAKCFQHKAYVCKECKKGFSRRDTFGRHVVTHRVSAGLHTCEVCKERNIESVFKRKDHLEQHKRNRHPHMSRPIIRSMLGNIRSDRYGCGDDLAETRSAAESYVSSCPELESDSESLRESDKQAIEFALKQIISKAESGMDLNCAVPRSDSPLENARLLRGIALLALCPPQQLAPEAKSGLKQLVHKLERIDLRSCI